MRSCLPLAPLLATFAHRGVALPGIRNYWFDPYSLRPNPLYPYYARSPTARSRGAIYTHDSRFPKDPNVLPSRTRRFTNMAKSFRRRRRSSCNLAKTHLRPLNITLIRDRRPSTGAPSLQTTVHITNDKDFALLLPKTPGGMFESV
jgi:hypothetical protein